MQRARYVAFLHTLPILSMTTATDRLCRSKAFGGFREPSAHSNPSQRLLRPASQNSHSSGPSRSAAAGGQPPEGLTPAETVRTTQLTYKPVFK